MLWEVSVTTCARQNGGYLQETLRSIDAAGWPGAAVVHDDTDFKLGPWGNMQRALRAAAESDPDAVLFVQDDVLLAANCREFLEWSLPKQEWWEKLGIASLYLNEATARKLSPGWSVAPKQQLGQWGGGACAFVMPRHSLQMLAKDFPWPESFHLCEIWLQVFCDRASLHWLDYNPSLSRHIGKVSGIKRIPNESMERPEPAWSEWRREGEWAVDCSRFSENLETAKTVQKSTIPPKKPVATTLF